MVLAAWLVAMFFAANIGASGTAASMGAAYGAGAIRRKWLALFLVSVFAFLGATLGGGRVVSTISNGIVPSRLVTVEITLIVLAAACATLFISNVVGVPLSTSEVTVGAVVGAGLAVGHVHAGRLAFIVSMWLVVPFLSMVLSYLLGLVARRLDPWISRRGRAVAAGLYAVLVASGCYEAFSAGMHNVANAVGPLVASHVLTVHAGLYWGALFVALGAFALGGRVLETNAKRITNLSVLQGIVVSVTSASLVLAAALGGIPVPQVQATTLAIFGVGQSHIGFDVWRQKVVRTILKTWLVSPLVAMLASYLVIEAVVMGSYVPLVVSIGSVVVALLYWSMRPQPAPRVTRAQRPAWMAEALRKGQADGHDIV
ncbi:inorganic phosphate transporter [Alicyclobacillus sendaiensis]|uniref:Phosphate transporter n=1 Tax=Alicyclobacillus sendaiensis PA2 TaxID=3029425 RepID=A0ABT6XWA0_ALISE|nr:inorganic phosphate transporter [Alicyclobacillus sendaiensis]MDI9259297.1 inorganic phosphate transporter [Alicyclobacillus sendaiensis PA2]